MKKVLMVLSISLFLFSCGETNKSEKTGSSEVNDSQNVEDQIVGKWIVTGAMGLEGEEKEDNYIIIKDDCTVLQVTPFGTSTFNWSIKDNQFCQSNEEFDIETCGSFNLEGDKLEWNIEDMGILKYRKSDQ